MKGMNPFALLQATGNQKTKLGSFAFVRQPGLLKESYEFDPALIRFKTDLVRRRVRGRESR